MSLASSVIINQQNPSHDKDKSPILPYIRILMSILLTEQNILTVHQLRQFTLPR